MGISDATWEEKNRRKWHSFSTHLAIPPYLERDQISLLAERRSRVGNGLEKNTGKKKVFLLNAKQSDNNF